MTVLNVQSQTFQVGGNGAAAGATTLPLQSFKDILGVNLAIASFGAVGYGTIEPNTSHEDSITFTGITQNADGSATLTGVNSVGFISPYTASSGLRLSHAGNVPFIISNTSAYMATFANKQNVETLTANWAVPDPVGSTDIANKQYVLSVATGGAVTTDKVIITAQIAGETVAAGNIVYQKVADSRWWKADGNVTATVLGVKFGVALGSGTAGNAITGGVQLAGTCAAFTGLTANTKYYLSDTAGAVSTSVGTVGVEIGLATATTTILLNFNSVASETSAGIVEEATDAEVSAGTAVGATGSKLFITPTKLRSSGVFKFGGTGADSVLAITSGATNIDLGGLAVVTKNYTSISITGTGSLTFSNPNASGTVIKLKSQGNVTITTSTNPAIDLRGFGGGNGIPVTTSGAGSVSADNLGGGGGGGAGGGNGTTSGAAAGTGWTALSYLISKFFYLGTGGNGGSGYNWAAGGAGGGGGGGSIVILYNTLTTNSGTFTVNGGSGGSGSGGGGNHVGGKGAGSIYIECNGALNITSTINASGANGNNSYGSGVGDGGAGGAGYSLIALNTEFV